MQIEKEYNSRVQGKKAGTKDPGNFKRKKERRQERGVGRKELRKKTRRTERRKESRKDKKRKIFEISGRLKKGLQQNEQRK